MANWETFTRRLAQRGAGPQVGIQRGGMIAVNHAAYEALAQPEAVELLFDRDDRLMGMRKVEKTVPHAYPMRRQGRTESFLISGRAFASHFGIPTDVGRRYRAVMSNEVLVVDLNTDEIAKVRR